MTTIASGTLDSGEAILPTIEAQRSPVVRWVANIVPWVVIAAIAAILLIPNLISGLPLSNDYMFITGLLTTFFALVAFLSLFRHIFSTFDTLWRRNIIAGAPARLPSSESLRDQYERFVRGIGQRMNNRWQWALGFGFALVVPLFIWQPQYPILPL